MTASQVGLPTILSKSSLGDALTCGCNRTSFELWSNRGYRVYLDRHLSVAVSVLRHCELPALAHWHTIDGDSRPVLHFDERIVRRNRYRPLTDDDWSVKRIRLPAASRQQQA